MSTDINDFNLQNSNHQSQSSFMNYFQQCPQQYSTESYQPFDIFPQYPLSYHWSCLGQRQPNGIPYTHKISQRVGGSVMVYRLVFRPPFTWTYNCFCDCEENTIYVPRVPGQHMNFAEANKYVKGQLREAYLMNITQVTEAFRSIGVIPKGLIITTSFWPFPAFIVNDINIAKANYIKGKYFYTLSQNALELRCEAKNTTICANKGNFKSFQETATLTIDVLNILTQTQRQELATAIQQSLENRYVTFISSIQLLDDSRNRIVLDP
uniref:Uncharacterized protein n=2 Tax=Onchocerca TaxID=6281 RepID=A0A8R1U2S7_ONCVO